MVAAVEAVARRAHRGELSALIVLYRGALMHDEHEWTCCHQQHNDPACTVRDRPFSQLCSVARRPPAPEFERSRRRQLPRHRQATASWCSN